MIYLITGSCYLLTSFMRFVHCPSPASDNHHMFCIYALAGLCLVAQSGPTLCHPMDYSLSTFSVHGNSPVKNIAMGCHSLLQRSFPIQGSNRFPALQVGSLPSEAPGKPIYVFSVVFNFSLNFINKWKRMVSVFLWLISLRAHCPQGPSMLPQWQDTLLFLRLNIIALVGKIPWRRERVPTPGFWPGEFHGLHSPWGREESDTTEWLSLSHYSSVFTSSVYLYIPWRTLPYFGYCK